MNNLISCSQNGEISYIEKDGQFLFSAEEIGKQLGYANPAKSINILFNRNYQELLTYSADIKLMYRDGKPRYVRHFTEEGVYILSMLANTEQARDFRKRVAELLKTLRQAKIREIEAHAFQKGVQSQKSLPVRHNDWRLMEKAVKLYQKGLPLTDIAKVIGCKPDTIRERLQRIGAWEHVKNAVQFSKNSPKNEPVQGSLLSMSAGSTKPRSASEAISAQIASESECTAGRRTERGSLEG